MAIYKEDIVNIELENGNIHRSFLKHSIGSGDDDANRFGVRAFRNGAAENIGGSCTGYFIRSDGATVVITGGVVSGNVAYVTLPETCYAVEGNFSLAIKCSGGGVTGTLRIVDGVVSRTTTNAAVDPGTVIPSIEDLIDDIEAAVASIPADYSSLWSTVAPAFSSSTEYSAGDYVTYNGALYQFISDHSGTWASADVIAVDVGGEFLKTNARIDDANDRIDNTREEMVEIAASEAYHVAHWYQGTVSQTTGQSVAATNRCRTDYLYFNDAVAFTIEPKSGYECAVLRYSTSGYSGYIQEDRAFSTGKTVHYTDGNYFRIVIKKTNDADFTPDNISEDPIILTLKLNGDTNIERITSMIRGHQQDRQMLWIQGGISYTDGGNREATNRCRSAYLYFGNASITIKPMTGYKINVYRFGVPSQASSFIYEDRNAFKTEMIQLDADFNYIRIAVAKTDDSDITPAGVPDGVVEICVMDGENNLPDYYQGYIQGKIADINEAVNASGINGEAFIFITDLHWDSGNAKKSPMLVKRILEECNITTMICGGDMINGGEKDNELGRTLDCVKAFQFMQAGFPVAFGNHDSNHIGNDEDSTQWFSRDEVWGIQMKQAANEITLLNSVDFSFTYDRPGSKTRFLVVDTGVDSAIASGAKNSIYSALMDVPEGWNVIVLGHWLYSVTNAAFTASGAELAEVLDAYNAKTSITKGGVTYNYAGTHGEVKCILIGHSHADAQGTTEGGIPFLLTDCDNYRRSNESNRTVNTTGEQCFDVIGINYDTDTVSCIRIGGGSDRTFSSGSWS